MGDYQLPPEHVCDASQETFDLSFGTAHQRASLFQRLLIYKGRIYDFCLILYYEHDGQRYEIERTDCCHSEVHKHRKYIDRPEDRVVLAPLSEGQQALVEDEYDRAYEYYLDSWEQCVARWKGN
ncbi:hypothetical protein [Rhodococcus rhodochrous]|uniref:Uncharacterized protein n=1 Tax=Rhodococcus rhodochrous J45 TaxID=935266 RepID=A0A562D8V3_RHORH|nr:hypothetical protein [Rhodococcus rhodochrous]TWH05761.1 hypothetical protein L618_000800000820 [Rhodococcus rhodochrous J45]